MLDASLHCLAAQGSGCAQTARAARRRAKTPTDLLVCEHCRTVTEASTDTALCSRIISSISIVD